MSLTENLGRTESKRRADILIKSETEKKDNYKKLSYHIPSPRIAQTCCEYP